MQVLFTDEGQQLIDDANMIKTRCAEVAAVYFEVAPLAFNKGFYSVDMTFFFKIVFTVCPAPGCAPTLVEGLGIFCKKVILFGSEAGVRTFSTAESLSGSSPCVPTVNVQVLDPMVLSSRICEERDHRDKRPTGMFAPPPPEVAAQFSGCFENVCARRTLYVTLGLFSIVQLMRQVQIMVPIYDFCIPNSECTSADLNSDPCELFSKVEFPTDEFFPPKLADFESD